MKRRLAQVANELNIGIETLVEFLSQKGIFIENKPSFGIEEKAYQIALKEFQKSLLIRKQADRMVIGRNEGTKLVKIAQELNVPTKTIVEFLSQNGIFVKNKPNTVIPKKLHQLLVKRHELLKNFDNLGHDELDNLLYSYAHLPTHEIIEEETDLTENGTKENIEKLSLIANLIVGIQNAKKEIKWEDLEFFDGRILIKVDYTSISLFDKRAKKSYNLIKPFFIKQSITPPVLFKTERQTKIEGVDNFFNLLEVGKLIYNLQLEEYKASSLAVNKINSLSSKLALSNTDILRLFSQTKYECIEFLSEKQEKDFKIIPVLESVFQQDKVLRYDESFVFTILRRHHYFLIWESTEIKKATHIFCFNELTISEGRKKLQSYILDAVDYKRERLHHQNDPATKELSHIRAVNHTNFQDWKKRLMNVLNSTYSITK